MNTTTITEALATARGAVTDARAILDAAKAQRDAIATRIEEATKAVEDAKAARGAIVARVATGEVISAAQLHKADQAISAAQANHALLRDALSVPAAEIVKAEAALVTALKEEAQVRYEHAVEDRIKAAEELDRAGAAYNAAAQRFLDTGDAAMQAMDGVRTSVRLDQISRLRDKRLIRNPLSPLVQTAVVQTNSVVHGSIAADERIAFS